jgi:hypothetical protein
VRGNGLDSQSTLLAGGGILLVGELLLDVLDRPEKEIPC